MGNLFTRWIGDPDDVFAYKTLRTVRIRDKRIGLTFVSLQLGILAYIIYQLLVSKQYLKPTNVIGISRLQVERPTASYRWPDGVAPYCLGGTAAAPGGSQYSVNSTGGTYKWIAGGGGLVAPQHPCEYLDSAFAVPDMLENGALFLTTRVTVTEEVVQPSVSACFDTSSSSASGDLLGLSHSNCSYAPVDNSSVATAYVADASMFTLYIDHNFAAPAAGIRRTSREMAGQMVDANGADVDPCAAYAPGRAAGFAAPCPSYVNVGVAGARDIIPFATLLEAAGISSLDQVAGTDPSLADQTLRYSGLVLLLTISYDNYHSFNASDVRYTYSVATVPNTEYKTLQTVTSNNSFPYPIRRTYNRHGIRIVISQGGTIGYFDFQTLLINLTVSLGLLSAAVFATDTLALYACPQRAVYSQYKERATVAFTHIRDAHAKELFRRFKAERDLVDPVPPIFSQVLGDRSSTYGSSGGSGSGGASKEAGTAAAVAALSAVRKQAWEPVVSSDSDGSGTGGSGSVNSDSAAAASPAVASPAAGYAVSAAAVSGSAATGLPQAQPRSLAVANPLAAATAAAAADKAAAVPEWR